MDYLKYLKTLGIVLAIFLVTLIVMTLLYNFNIIGSKVLKVFEVLILLLSIFGGGFALGKNVSSKGYLEGIKFSIIVILLILGIGFVFNIDFGIKLFIYYSAIIASSVIGSIIGINKKGKTDE